MRRTLFAMTLLLCLVAMPAFADTISKTVKIGQKTFVIVATYTDYNGNGRIDTLRELLSIVGITVTAS